MPSGQVLVAAALIGLAVYGGSKAVKAADHGLKKIGHSVAHIFKK